MVFVFLLSSAVDTPPACLPPPLPTPTPPRRHLEMVCVCICAASLNHYHQPEPACSAQLIVSGAVTLPLLHPSFIYCLAANFDLVICVASGWAWANISFAHSCLAFQGTARTEPLDQISISNLCANVVPADLSGIVYYPSFDVPRPLHGSLTRTLRNITKGPCAYVVLAQKQQLNTATPSTNKTKQQFL